VLTSAYDDFRGRVERGEDTAIDPYADENPAEFFAVLSEVFFADPLLLLAEYPEVYGQFAAFYRQDPARQRGGGTVSRLRAEAGGSDADR